MEYQVDLEGFARRFFREFFTRLEPGVLVLDNYHEAAGAAFDVILRDAITQVPHGNNIVVISRSGPESGFQRLIANQSIVDLGWTDLCLTESEVVSISRSMRPDAIAPPAQLHATCGGWVAGLVLLLRRHARAQVRTSDFASREVLFEYFTEEAFAAAEPQVRRVLVCTALLPQATASMVRTLCDDHRAELVLEELHRHQYFVDRRHGREPSFQFHDIFRDFLLAKGQTELGEELDSMRLRAAQLLELNGEHTEAVALHRLARNWVEIARLIKAHALQLNDTGRWQTINEWFRDLPEATIHSDPYLVYWQGKGLITNDPARAQTLLTAALARFSECNDHVGMVYAINDLDDLLYNLDQRLHDAMNWLLPLEHYLDSDPQFDNLETGGEAWAAYIAIVTQSPSDGRLLDKATRWLHAALSTGTLNANAQLNAAHMALAADMVGGEYVTGLRLFELIKTLVQLEETNPTRRLYATVWLGHWSIACGDFSNAILCYQRAIELSTSMAALNVARRTCAGLASALCYDDRPGEAAAMLRRFENYAGEPGPLAHGVYLQASAAHAAANKNFTQAMTHIDAALT
jgi:tetratricopeptide (TPR) repeat protein